MKTIANVSDPSQVLVIDALRLSLQIEKTMSRRLWGLLHRFERLNDGTPPRTQAALDAIAQCWQLIDTTHRIRRLSAQVRGLSHTTPTYQLFRRNTDRVEAFRNFFQHLTSEIPNLPKQTNPILGVLSWVTKEQGKSRTIIVGTFPKDGTFYTLALDTWTGKFATRLQLTAGQMDIDLEAVHAEVIRFGKYLEKWLSKSGYLGSDELRPAMTDFHFRTLGP